MNAIFEIKKTGNYHKVYRYNELMAWMCEGFNDNIWNMHPALKNAMDSRFETIDFINSIYDNNLFFYGIASDF